MFKYDVGMYENKQGNKIKITELVFDDGYEGYNVELLDNEHKQLYNLMENEVDELLND